MSAHYHGDPATELALDSFVKLLRAAEMFNASLHRELNALGLSASQFGALEAVYHVGPMCQRDLGRKLLRSGANMTSVVDNLEGRGLMRRVRQTDDRRYVNIELTPEGANLIREIFPAHALRIRALLNRALTTEETAQLGALCRKLGLSLRETQ